MDHVSVAKGGIQVCLLHGECIWVYKQNIHGWFGIGTTFDVLKTLKTQHISGFVFDCINLIIILYVSYTYYIHIIHILSYIHITCTHCVHLQQLEWWRPHLNEIESLAPPPAPWNKICGGCLMFEDRTNQQDVNNPSVKHLLTLQ